MFERAARGLVSRESLAAHEPIKLYKEAPIVDIPLYFRVCRVIKKRISLSRRYNELIMTIIVRQTTDSFYV